MVDLLLWLLAVEFLGLLALPLAFVLFRRLPDRGFSLAKPMALILFSYVLWVLGLARIAPNSLMTIAGILAFGAVAAGLVWRGHRAQLAAFFRREWRTLVVGEVLFLGFFLLWAGIVSEIPAINHTEKPMDFAFLNAVLQSRYFPPEDPWLAGHPISYYYFGHFTMAFLTRLSTVPSSVGYNLAVSLVPALVAVGAFGLVHNLVRLTGGSWKAAVGFGLAAPALVLLVGNLEGVLEFVHAQGWGSTGFWQWVGIKGLEGASPSFQGASSAFPEQNWWWWRATRVIDTLADGQSLDYTITEFPMFSFLLGDLHPHVVSLPFVILGLSLCLNLFLSVDRLGLGWLWRHPWEAAALSLFLGAVAFINAWDFPLLAAALALLVFARAYQQEGGNLSAAGGRAALMVAPILTVAVVLFLPYYSTFDGQASGILPWTKASTRPFLFFLVIGLSFLLSLSLVLRQLTGLAKPSRREAPAIALVILVAVAPLLVWSGIVFFITDGVGAALAKVASRALWIVPGLAMVAFAGFSAFQRVLLGRDTVMVFPLVLAAIAVYLLVGAELFYVADLFGNRMNTVFKVYYQAWLLLSLAGSYGLYYWHSKRPGFRQSGSTVTALSGAGRGRFLKGLGYHAWTVCVVMLVLASLYYPVGAVLDRTGVLRDGLNLKNNTLDGLDFIAGLQRGEYAAIQWLRDRAPKGRIVEAVGDDYSEYGRISSSTGLPTVLGWRGHELQWRGGSKLLDGRAEDVAAIYQSNDGDEVRRLLEKYQVRYVYLGHRERSSYGARYLAGFTGVDGILKTMFEQDGVIIYELAQRAIQPVPPVQPGDGGGPS